MRRGIASVLCGTVVALATLLVPTETAVTGMAFPRVDVTFADGTTCSASGELPIA